ncbi:Uncharacterised protein [Afipia felis]|uniref:Uncharacterized protein n=3 Tax=Afipia felis TaxID=1035 RepID=A0A380WBR6_AFIFE|nr:hypothetical protein HMPREF9697_01834 [Afipia felis ATCC 53690]SUU78014.1 Uncharacterised protein [Afipia felis]SUU86079.1 Uncharacterised protein [Afipia felis]
MREALEPCRVEHKAFDKWAEANRYDMHQHSLHYLFVDPETYAARQGWKAALEYVSSALSASEAKAGGPS